MRGYRQFRRTQNNFSPGVPAAAIIEIIKVSNGYSVSGRKSLQNLGSMMNNINSTVFPMYLDGQVPITEVRANIGGYPNLLQHRVVNDV